MEADSVLNLVLALGTSVAKPAAKYAARLLKEMEARTQNNSDFRTPKEIIKESGLLKAANLSFSGIDRERAMRVIELSDNNLPADIPSIGDPGLREVAMALESIDYAYSQFVNARGVSPELARQQFYRSRAVNLYIRETWPGSSMFEGAKLCESGY